MSDAPTNTLPLSALAFKNLARLTLKLIQWLKNTSKKTLPEALITARACYEHVELWTVDEHRLGLKPVLGKLWAPQGQRPVVSVYPRYEWLYLYGFVQPQTGRTVWYLLPTLNKAAFELVLDNFATTVAASATEHVLIVMDNAPWHSSVTPPEGVGIIYQPTYSPELQPAEHLWQLSDEPLKNRTFDSLDALEQTLTAQCVNLMADPERVKAHTLFHW